MGGKFQQASNRLREKREALIQALTAGNEAGFLTKNTAMLDDYFRESFETSMVGPKIGIVQNPYAIIALGGYGREEMCLNSDIDLLFCLTESCPRKPRKSSGRWSIPFGTWDMRWDTPPGR